MQSPDAGLERQRGAAAERVRARASERRQRIEAIREPGGLVRADAPERIAKRMDRLSRYYAGEALPRTEEDVPSGAPDDVVAAALARRTLQPRAATEPEDVPERPGVLLEKVIGTADFLDARYLEAGVSAARAVCRVQIRDPSGRVVGHGSGSLVSPRLLLTNHHVLESSEVAAASAAEFNFQDGVDGQPLQPRVFGFEPATFFVADEQRDFALVAVRAADGDLAEFGFNPLVEAEGKAVVGEFVTIVQHPRGERKQVSLRENRIVDLPDAFMHYEADTEPGSSGSPVFNDQWEVVALHHASVHAPDQTELGGFLNEGIRISRILQFLTAQELPAEQRALLDQLRLERISLGNVPAETRTPALDGAAVVRQALGQGAGDGGTIRLSLPLEVSIRVAGGAPAGAARASIGPAVPAPPAAEAITIDPDYESRKGYDSDFLGAGSLSVPLPTLSEELRAKVATTSTGADSVLRYHHFAVVMNKERRLAFFTAVNIDGLRSRRLKRERDRWFLDPRIPVEDETGEAVYADNDLDRGHLVRRLDPAWGDTEDIAKLANDDTFHFTNCTPQHKDFNQRQTTWAGLEDYILENADNRDFRASVFTGPVLAEDDDEYRDVKLPRQFWKVAVMVRETGQLSATAYLLSQEELLHGLETAAEFSYGAYKTFQVPLTRVEELTGISFGELRGFDPLGALETVSAGRELRSEADLVL